jgi:hypothetical protein
MNTFIQSTSYKKTIEWLSQYIQNNPSADLHFRNIIYILKQEKNHYVKCVLLDNRYLYGSFLAAAKESIFK